MIQTLLRKKNLKELNTLNYYYKNQSLLLDDNGDDIQIEEFYQRLNIYSLSADFKFNLMHRIGIQKQANLEKNQENPKVVKSFKSRLIERKQINLILNFFLKIEKDLKPKKTIHEDEEEEIINVPKRLSNNL